ncbi:glycosyl hydrolase family 5 [Fibrobacter sp. UBA4297]|uniref:glycosyl hydrolase family 5 n=1 Tax=Fibrobacter sp. UBA4297 TaxID=1946536 RepID=UPI0025BB4792|nr:glycosyl hydrolase family 5 [Fibrobacter sp. UBA4297]
MKTKLFKTLAIFGLSFIAWNCSEDPASTAANNAELPPVLAKPALEVDQNCWMITTGSQIFLIVPNGTGAYLVTNEASIPVGTYNVASGAITDLSGATIITNVKLETLPVVNPDKTISYPDGSKATIDGKTLLLPGGIDPNAITPGTNPGTVASSSSAFVPGIPAVSSSSAKNVTPNPAVSSSSQKTQQPVASSSSKQQEQPKSSSATSNNKQCNGQCYDSASGKCVNYYDQMTGSKGEKYAYDNDCKVNCYYDPENKNCQNMTGSTPSQQPKSSSSVKSSSSQQQQQPKSSSSKQQEQPKSSSSQQQQQNNPNASAEEAKYLNAGAGGQQGFATRYWDCCMPHCSWPEHGGAAKTCDAKGKTPIGNTNGSICSGGQGTTCTSQIPIIVSDKLAYAFAATPGNDATCGKCFALTFTGTGKYETKANHQALKGKTLVVMASNIGYDVQGGQFDIMIPGGGFGAFNGCSQMGWNIPSNSTTYGGLLSDCEKEVGYSGDLLTKRKQCLTEKCNKSFGSDTQAKEGCLFLATWMEAAGNPNHTYKEVECPAALKAQF